MLEEEKNQPCASFQSGNISSAVWKEEVQKDGDTYIQYSVKIQKQFKKTKESEYKPTNYYFRDELPRLQLVVAKAYEFICLHGNKKTEEEIPI